MNNDDLLFAQRLRSARVMRQLSIDKLLERMIDVKISKPAISKYENGRMLPSPEVRSALARALEVDEDYFSRPMVANEDARIDFRKKSSMGAKEVNALAEKAKDKVARYIEVENLLRQANALPQPEQLPRPVQPIRTKDEVIAFAQQVRQQWELGTYPIQNVQRLLEDHDIKVIPIEAQDDFDGLCGNIDGNNPFVVINSNPEKTHIERRRLTAMHELGHLLMNFAPEVEAKQRETLCHVFANEMLMPTAAFDKRIPRGFTISLITLRPLQLEYGISIDALVKKCQETGRISQSQYTQYNIKKSVPSFREAVEISLFNEANIYEHFASLTLWAYMFGLIEKNKAKSLLYDAPDYQKELEVL